MEEKEVEKEDFDEESFDEFDEEEETQEQANSKLEELKKEVERQSQMLMQRKFARVESKPEFASEIINAESNQKIANLQQDEISELLEKRKFVNLLVNFKWNRLANRLLCNIRDVENYSLSAEGFLPKQVFTESSKSAQYNYQLDQKKKKGGKTND